MYLNKKYKREADFLISELSFGDSVLEIVPNTKCEKLILDISKMKVFLHRHESEGVSIEPTLFVTKIGTRFEIEIVHIYDHVNCGRKRPEETVRVASLSLDGAKFHRMLAKLLRSNAEVCIRHDAM
jgi:hypothetical protein